MPPLDPTGPGGVGDAELDDPGSLGRSRVWNLEYQSANRASASRPATLTRWVVHRLTLPGLLPAQAGVEDDAANVPITHPAVNWPLSGRTRRRVTEPTGTTPNGGNRRTVAHAARQTNFRLTPVSREELRAIYAITRECFDVPYTVETLADYLNRAGTGFIVARTEGGIVGFAVATATPFPLSLVRRVGEIALIGVLPSHQRQGLGQTLLSASFGHLRGRGMREVRLHVSVDNVGAIALYKRNGMRVAHVVRRYYRNRHDAFRMVGRL